MQAGVIFTGGNQEVAVDADILDISQTGIRVKLKQAFVADIEGFVKITMTLPDSGSPFSVHGIIKHQQADDECGVRYIADANESIDDVIFECLELDASTVLIKTV
jgi:PilZ domain